MKVIIAGGRDFQSYATLKGSFYEFLKEQKEDFLDKSLSDTLSDIEIVSGCARGADSVGELFASRRGLPIKRFPADWKQHGKSAGYLRNKEMAEYANGLLAFWDGKSRGTKHMIDTAKKKGLDVKVVMY